MIGCRVACRRPERIARLVILNTAAFLLPAEKKLPLRLAIIRNTPLGAPLVRGLNAFAWGATRMAVVKPLPRAVRAGYLLPYNSWHNRVATLRFVQDIPLRPHDPSYTAAQWTDEHLHRLKEIPKLICWGARDFVFDDAFLSEWRRRFPDARTQRFADAGHYVLEDAGDRVITMMRGFLSTDPAGSTEATASSSTATEARP
jgi:pimeloyl-ACP methyl ester carboxylesterase